MRDELRVMNWHGIRRGETIWRCMCVGSRVMLIVLMLLISVHLYLLTRNESQPFPLTCIRVIRFKAFNSRIMSMHGTVQYDVID